VDRCPECGKSRGLLMEEHDINVLERIASSPALIVAVCLLMALGFAGFEAIIR
jgi:hypothetical protein